MENPELFEPIKNTPTTSSVGAQKIAKPTTTEIKNIAGQRKVSNKLYDEFVDSYAKPGNVFKGLSESAINETVAKPSTKMINTVAGIGNEIEGYLKKQSGEMAKAAEKNIAKAAPMETPYGKSFLSYTPEGKIAGVPGKVLRGLGKVAGPVGAALTAVDMGGALAELRKLGAEKIAEENEVKEMQAPVSQLRKYTPEERMRVKEMLKKLRSEAKLRS